MASGPETTLFPGPLHYPQNFEYKPGYSCNAAGHIQLSQRLKPKPVPLFKDAHMISASFILLCILMFTYCIQQYVRLRNPPTLYFKKA